jgi:hypothetical protein
MAKCNLGQNVQSEVTGKSRKIHSFVLVNIVAANQIEQLDYPSVDVRFECRDLFARVLS